ncbi:NAD(P)-binding protein [Sporormia fimetaria CBS 119925]|uniref:NAD(P)-binding protein n=1 Tax=Sporormia fimetaria CBS 119925 TaxID=1340428 RepID=A0A6A6UVW3_9PLEO|nr:NAD(P)-binding protein [Sporormia fimetaria CBS 119925]
MSTSQKPIAVMGITGTQGSSVATHFLKHKDWHIRGITRNPSSSKAKAWASKGVEVVQANQEDPESLKNAFRGAHAIFTVTNFASNWTKVSESKDLQEKASRAGRSVGQYAADLERAQGINAADAAADPEVLSTLEKFVFSTLAPVTEVSGGNYTHAWEFDSKAAVQRYIEDTLPKLAERMSTVTMGVYQETWPDIPAFAPQKERDGSYMFVRLKWPGEHVAQPQVIAAEDTGAFVDALVLKHPPGTHVLGASEIVTREQYAEIWGRAMGVKTQVKDLSEEEYRKYLPDEIADTMLDLFKFFPEYGYAGGNANVKTPQELGIQTTPLEEWVKRQDWSSVMDG